MIKLLVHFDCYSYEANLNSYEELKKELEFIERHRNDLKQVNILIKGEKENDKN